MNIKRLQSIVVFAALINILSITVYAHENKVEKRPNVIIFLADDLGWADVGYQGSEVYETPNIDQLANEGVRFINAYVTHPRCVPSRYSILTGKYPARIKCPGSGKMSLDELTIAEAMKKAGYSTFFTGKWHLSQNPASLPQSQGFDINVGGGKAGAPISYFFPYNEPPHHQFKINIDGLEEGDEGEYLTDRLTDETIKYLNTQVENNPGQPFFAMVSHYAVHEPLEAKEEHIKKFQEKIDKTEFKNPEYTRESNGLTKMRQDNAPYAGMVYSMDESLGRIMKTLKELEIADNTILIFFSDNGGLSNTGTEKRLLATSNFPLRAGKGHLYEGGVRVPLIVKLPGSVKNKKMSDAIVTGADIYPTILELAGLDLVPNQHLDGESFAGVLKDKNNGNKDRAIFWHNSLARPARTGDYYSSAVRKGDYKLIDFYEQNRVELYNIEKDIKEEIDISKENPEITKKLLALVKEWRDEVDAYIKPVDKKTKWE